MTGADICMGALGLLAITIMVTAILGFDLVFRSPSHYTASRPDDSPLERDERRS